MEPSARRDYETPAILSDQPLGQDEPQAHFHFDDFAATLARLIADKKTLTPLTIGVSGAWGSGKTSLLRRVQRQLDGTQALLKRGRTKAVHLDFANPAENPQEQFRVCRTVWFNAWKYADEDALLVALVRRIVQSMAGDDLVNQAIARLLDPSYPRRDVVNTVLGWFKVKAPGVEIGLDTGDPQPTPFAEKTAMLDLFDEAFDRLMAAWVHHRLDAGKIDPEEGVLVVFIDDLDRCLPPKVVQVLEAVKLFLDKEGCVFVLGADAEVVRQAVESHYQNAKVTGEDADKYLEKVIQLRFDLPPVGDEAMQAFLKDKGVAAEMLSEWRTLLAAAEVNPRRVKAVLNDIELQWRMLVNSGQAQGVGQADFIRWSALLRAAPPNFKQRIFDIDDPDLRLKFVQDALRWGAGDGEETLQRTFQEYEKASRRLKRVLGKMGAFGPGFDAATLDAFIHLAAPPAKAAQAGPPAAGGQAAGLSEAGEEIAGRAVGKPARGEPTAPGLEAAHPDRRSYAGIEFVRIPAGKFLMGSKEDNSLADDDEKPQHTVEISQEYWMGKYPVTNAQFAAFVQASDHRTTAEEKGSAYGYDGKEWKEIKGANWKHPRGPKSGLDGKEEHPAVSLSWDDAVAFCEWLNAAHGGELPPGWQFRLPTEAEWEKAARGEYGNEWPWGGERPDDSRCNFNMNVGDTTPVGKYSPQGDSPYGCADMAGNAWEWCRDWFDEGEYPRRAGKPVKDPQGPRQGLRRVLRGGSFRNVDWVVRCALRLRLVPADRYEVVGFRVVLSPIHL
jgi:formylglycine-generating enzyme required for sulfatase activity